MKNMKRNVLLIPFIAVLTLMVVGFASANLATGVVVKLNGEDILTGNELVSFSGDVVPIKVTFAAGESSSDVKVKVSVYDGRDDVSVSSGRFDIVSGKIYTKLLSLRLPSDIDSELDEMTLSIEIYDVDYNTVNYDVDYQVSMQRESYSLDVLSVDCSSKVSAGEVFPVSVVINNNGFNQADDNYVVASIPTLGVSSRGYAGDLSPVDDYQGNDGEEDSVYRMVYLKIPENAEAGVYEMEVVVYNDDTKTVVTQLISVDDSTSTSVLAAMKNQDLNAGETVTYDLIIVNSADDVKVFNIKTVSGDVLSVSAPSVITVGPDTSETVSVTVKAANDAAVGTYTFSVDVDGKQTVFGANVVEGSVSTSVVALTVVLVIIFIVLLAVLVVLLTRKEKPIDEVETSYY
ncbi:MAG: hypothetical protein ABIF18_04015 [archaeon]